MHIYHSADPQQPNAKGVAIVLNKEITNTQNVDYYEIIPGRAHWTKANVFCNYKNRENIESFFTVSLLKKSTEKILKFSLFYTKSAKYN